MRKVSEPGQKMAGEGAGATRAEKRPLGVGLRLVEGYYVLVFLIGILYAALINPTGDIGYVYDLSMVRAIIQLSCAMQVIWMIEQRLEIARPFSIISTLVSISLTSLDLIVFEGSAPVLEAMGPVLSPVVVALEFTCACVVVGYLALSERVRRTLTEPPEFEGEGEGNSWDEAPLRRRIRTWTFWRNLICYFIVFSFLGHWAEMLFCRLIVAGVFMGGYDPTNAMLWDQWLFPFSAEGTALAMVALFLHPLKERISRRCGGKLGRTLALSFLANAAVCTSIDFMTGIMCNQSYELWDYRDMPFNFMGQVCLQNSLVYSVAATLIVWVLYPIMDRDLRRCGRTKANVVFCGLVGFYAFEAALHFVVI